VVFEAARFARIQDVEHPAGRVEVPESVIQVNAIQTPYWYLRSRLVRRMNPDRFNSCLKNTKKFLAEPYRRWHTVTPRFGSEQEPGNSATALLSPLARPVTPTLSFRSTLKIVSCPGGQGD